jgi:hypothetical protein
MVSGNRLLGVTHIADPKMLFGGRSNGCRLMQRCLKR